MCLKIRHYRGSLEDLRNVFGKIFLTQILEDDIPSNFHYFIVVKQITNHLVIELLKKVLQYLHQMYNFTNRPYYEKINVFFFFFNKILPEICILTRISTFYVYLFKFSHGIGAIF